MYQHPYINEMFKRADIQQIREFLIAGVELGGEPDEQTYGERLEKASALIVKRIERISKDDDELDKIYTEFTNATGAYMDVFTEIGIKIGAKLMFQLLYQ